MPERKDAQWIEHEYLYTYKIAGKVEAVARNYTAYLHELEALTIDFGFIDFIPPWQRDTALHKFTRYIADDMLEADNSGEHKIPFGDDPIHPRWTIPIELALVTYGIQKDVEFEIPKIPSTKIERGRTTYYEDAPELLDACYEHFQGLRLTQAYEDLLYRLSDEVFFVMFTNRVTLQCLHEYLAYYVTENDPDDISDEYPEIAKFFTLSGRMRRTRIPMWARRAIYFRDRGICTKCKKNISGLVDRFSKENYDHIVSLAEGGLNDITNLQLLCESCNNNKSARPEPASNTYQRWY